MNAREALNLCSDSDLVAIARKVTGFNYANMIRASRELNMPFRTVLINFILIEKEKKDNAAHA